MTGPGSPSTPAAGGLSAHTPMMAQYQRATFQQGTCPSGEFRLILLDTNMVSEPPRPAPDPGVTE